MLRGLLSSYCSCLGMRVCCRTSRRATEVHVEKSYKSTCLIPSTVSGEKSKPTPLRELTENSSVYVFFNSSSSSFPYHGVVARRCQLIFLLCLLFHLGTLSDGSGNSVDCYDVAITFEISLLGNVKIRIFLSLVWWCLTFCHL